ncbi:MAG: hypothetical protein RL885_08845 [Planctomycetota bacterium]
MSAPVSSRTLCPRCLESVDTVALTAREICESCAILADRAEDSAPFRPTRNVSESWLRRQIDDAEDWAIGRSAWVRAPLLAYFGWVLIQHLGDPSYQSILKPLNLGIHELGHVVFGPFGQFLAIAGGSILQCLLPVLSVFMFYRQPDYFGIACALCWLSTNFFDVAVYIGDARSMSLPLVSPFTAHPLHDWNTLLQKMGLLHLDTTLAAGVRGLAIVTMLAGLSFGGWLLWRMIRPTGDRF